MTELAEVVACGFPLGFALSAGDKTFPAISVNAGTVTALRHKPKGGGLDRVRIDVALTFGNSGGPVLDDAGKVVGVVVSGVRGTRGNNLAIPMGQLKTFLDAPDIASTPRLTSETLGKPTEFKAVVTSFVPTAPEPALTLVLRAGDEPPRSFPTKA